ncbi:MAG TPA: hypothetical protein VH000_11415 [Rhizomicrobium sp.]|nr:hypothetical protein [Rhizomicrobium sp.]
MQNEILAFNGVNRDSAQIYSQLCIANIVKILDRRHCERHGWILRAATGIYGTGIYIPELPHSPATTAIADNVALARERPPARSCGAAEIAAGKTAVMCIPSPD